MEVIAQEIAKILNVSFETAVNMYPVIREQFIAYNILDSIGNFAFAGFAILVAISFGMAFIADDNNYFAHSKKQLRVKNESEYGNWSVDSDNQSILYARKFVKWFKIATTTVGITIITMITCSILKYLLAPDYSILLKLLT